MASTSHEPSAPSPEISKKTLWVIFNANGHRWGSEVYSSEDDARNELRRFWKGASVNLGRFYIREFPAEEAQTIKQIFERAS